jgi:hypothetical protein
MPEHSAHGDDLAFVMEGMRQYMMNHERWGADDNFSVGIVQLRIAADLLIRETSQICQGLFTDLAL